MLPLDDFLPNQLPADPLPLAADWLRHAIKNARQPNPNAMVLATVDDAGLPSARVVLCKEIDVVDGRVVFFTNYESRKGLDLALNGRAAIVMHWDSLHRQLRAEGQVRLAPAAESDAYFESRPWQRRIGAWASAQSRPLPDRAQLEAAVVQTAHRFGTPIPGPEDTSSPNTEAPRVDVPRPPFWGGYHLWIEALELWAEGGSRLHDRARWTRTVRFAAGDGPGQFVRQRPQLGTWSSQRLQP